VPEWNLKKEDKKEINQLVTNCDQFNENKVRRKIRRAVPAGLRRPQSHDRRDQKPKHQIGYHSEARGKHKIKEANRKQRK
jgi:hypothetical protein